VVTTAALLDLISLVRRELGVDDVRVVERGAPARVAAHRTIASCDLPDGRMLVARFEEPPPDVEALQRRLEMICESMRERLGEGPAGGSTRPAPTRTLRDELAALAMRAGALVGFVIDAHSPMVWGIGGLEMPPEDASDILPALTTLPRHEPSDQEGEPSTNDTLPQPARISLVEERSRDRDDGVTELDAPASGSNGASGHDGAQLHLAPEDDAEDEDLVARAITAVRALPAIETLPRGGHLQELVSDPDFGFFARSFAGIYVLVLVFDGPVDELVARRAVVHALPTIEQLVLSLPPVDPPDAGGEQMVVRRRARRR
jgi:hypothetical protein